MFPGLILGHATPCIHVGAQESGLGSTTHPWHGPSMSQLQCQTGCNRLGTKMTVKLCETGRKDCQRRTDNTDYRIQMPVAESPMKLHSISSTFLDLSAFLPCFDRNLSWNNWEIQLCHYATANFEWHWHWLGRCFFVLYRITWRAMWSCWWCCSQSLPAPRAHDESLQVYLQLPAGHFWISSSAKLQHTWHVSNGPQTLNMYQSHSTSTGSVNCVNVVWIWCECFGCCTAWTAWTSSTFSTTELKLTRWRFSSGAAACASNSVPRSQGSFTEYILSI